jgi:hypothetical protein
VIGLLVLVGVAAVAIAANWPRITTVPELRVLAALVAVVLAGSAAAGALFFSSRLRSQPAVQSLLTKLPFHDLLRKIQAAVYVYKHHPGMVVKVLLISVVVQLSVVGMAISYALALGGGVDLATFFFIVPIASLAMSIPIGMPGGLGQSEIAYIWLFRTVGYGGGFLLALLQRVNYALWALVGAVLYFRRRGKVQRARQLAEESDGLELESAAEVEAASRAG